jgi:hypothetical protein
MPSEHARIGLKPMRVKLSDAVNMSELCDVRLLSQNVSCRWVDNINMDLGDIS